MTALRTRGRLGVGLAIGIFLVCLVASLAFGPVSLSPDQLLHYLVQGPVKGDPGSVIFWQIRMPRVLTAFIVGAALAAAGVILQDLFLNPLTDPYVTGVSSGAALGATLAIVAGVATGAAMTGLAMAGGLATLLVVWIASRRRGRTDIFMLLLAGVTVSYLLTAVITVLMIRAGNGLDQIFYWILGSFSGRGWGDVEVAMVALPFMAVPFFYTREMNIMLQGETRALQLGVEVERAKVVLIGTAAILTAVAVSVSGIIGFVGLVVPHIVRLLVGPNHRRLLPFSLLIGAALMGLADLVSRVALAPSEIPVGVVTTLIGAPVFVYLLKRSRRAA